MTRIDDNTKSFAPLLVALAVVALCVPVAVAQDDRPAITEVDQCAACHYDEEYMPEGWTPADVHMQEGLSCAGCHGGDPTEEDAELAMSEAAGFIGVPDRGDIPDMCGGCHSSIDIMRQYQPRIATDQVAQYWTSVHGQKLREGDEKVAECASCHSAHAILAANDTRSTVHALNVPGMCRGCHSDADYMAEYGIPVDQYDQYARSVHGRALLENQDTGSPACNDCHGNHGAIPPGISSIRQVCGACHVNNMEYFTASEMGKAFEVQDLHGCEECHGNHEIEKTYDDMIGHGPRSVCIDCHEQGDKGHQVAGAIRAQLASLSDVYNEAEERAQEVHRIGMDDVEIGFLLQEAHQDLIQSRTLVHTFDTDRVAERTQAGVTKARQAIELADGQVRDYQVRRRGFGMATLFITLVIVALFVKIRQMETS